MTRVVAWWQRPISYWTNDQLSSMRSCVIYMRTISRELLHWNDNVVILMKFSSLVTLEVVILTTSCAASDKISSKWRHFPIVFVNVFKLPQFPGDNELITLWPLTNWHIEAWNIFCQTLHIYKIWNMHPVSLHDKNISSAKTKFPCSENIYYWLLSAMVIPIHERRPFSGIRSMLYSTSWPF